MNQITIENTFVGIHEYDAISSDNLLPNTKPGFLGCGIVKDGNGSAAFKQGDLVCYINPLGDSFKKIVNVDQNHLLHIPNGLSPKIIAALFFRINFAYILTSRVFIVRPNSVIVVHDIATASNRAVAQLCKKRGAKVIGTVLDKHMNLSYCDHVVTYDDNFENKINDITSGFGVHAVYNGCAKEEILNSSINVLSKLGILISYNYSSFYVKTLSIPALTAKSLFFVSPYFFDYKLLREEIVLSADDIFHYLMSGEVEIDYREYNFDQLDILLQKIKNSEIKESPVINL